MPKGESRIYTESAENSHTIAKHSAATGPRPPASIPRPMSCQDIGHFGPCLRADALSSRDEDAEAKNFARFKVM